MNEFTKRYKASVKEYQVLLDKTGKRRSEISLSEEDGALLIDSLEHAYSLLDPKSEERLRVHGLIQKLKNI